MSDESDAELELGLHDEEEPNLIATRQRRGNAGNRLQALLQAEEPLDDEDNIFMEFEDDDDFEEGAEEDMEDEESDEEEENDDEGTSQQQGHHDGEPVSRKRKAGELEDDENFSSSESSDENEDQEPEDAGEEELQKQQRQERRKKDEVKKRKMFEIKTLTARVAKKQSDKKESTRHRTTAADLMDKSRRVSKRSAAVQNTKAVIERLKESEKRRASLPQQPKKKTVKKMTQEERLAEAKITERKNTASLNRYFELEEARKQRQRAAMLARRKPMRNVIRFVSTTKLVPPRRIYNRPKIEVITEVKHEKTEQEKPAENGEPTETNVNEKNELGNGVESADKPGNDVNNQALATSEGVTEGQISESATNEDARESGDKTDSVIVQEDGVGPQEDIDGSETHKGANGHAQLDQQEQSPTADEHSAMSVDKPSSEADEAEAVVDAITSRVEAQAREFEEEREQASRSPLADKNQDLDLHDRVDHEGDVDMADASTDSKDVEMVDASTDLNEPQQAKEDSNHVHVSEAQTNVDDQSDNDEDKAAESPSTEKKVTEESNEAVVTESNDATEEKSGERRKYVAFADDVAVNADDNDSDGANGTNQDGDEATQQDSKENEGSQSPSQQKHGHFDASQVEAPEAYMPHTGRRNAKARRASHHTEPHIFPGLPDVQGPYAMRQRNTVTLLNFDDELAYTKYKVKAILFGDQALQSQPKLQSGKTHIPTTTTTVTSTGEIIVKERATSYYDPLEVFLQQQSRTCTITGKLAKFSDPDTGIKYATLDAFSMIQLVKEGHLTWNSALGGCYRGSVGEKHAAGVPPGFAAPILTEPDGAATAATDTAESKPEQAVTSES